MERRSQPSRTLGGNEAYISEIEQLIKDLTPDSQVDNRSHNRVEGHVNHGIHLYCAECDQYEYSDSDTCLDCDLNTDTKKVCPDCLKWMIMYHSFVECGWTHEESNVKECQRRC